VHPAVQAVLSFGIDVTLAYHATESGLNMRARAAEPVVKVEMAEGGIEVVAPKQADHAATEPDAFRVAGRAGEHARRLGYLVDALLAVFDGIAGRLLFGRFGATALGERRGRAEINGIVPPV
jgi:hypothetical protein